ncbi:VanZ family protein [Polynucleobacter sp. MG-28-Ekke-A2]|uniref:VanZ family protein n=1 Tax=Polynucleobacter sp. MG-28-Ekke-A2 TaxID=3108276 RepID=UPI002B22E33E|nr:VanZ family protein [Polynucleobacter sp. MG-28-Ekke-A2]MEA9601209.1 VanZ family protein [Polynucleobacter sp. MG-28-Ekke-A2]
MSIIIIFKYTFWLTFAILTYLFLVPQQYLIPEVFDWWDKLQHSLAFGVLTILGLLAYARTGSEVFRVIIVLSIYGALIEVLQTLSGWRYGEFRDWVADVLGVVIAWGVFALIQNNQYLSRIFKTT